MPLTGPVLRNALAAAGAVGNQLRTLDELAAGADTALRQSPAVTPAGAAAFLATCAVESAWFRTTVEYGTTLRYDPFRGRTFIQLTHEANYRGFGQWCAGRGLVADPEMFVRSPVSLGAYDFAWLGAVYYFEATRLWDWANTGDFRRVSQAVNGGRSRAGTSFTPNGWSDRQAMYAVFMRAGNDLLLPAAAAPDRAALTHGMRNHAEVRKVQAFLARAFPAYAAKLPATGNFYEETRRAVAEFQRRAGITGPDADGRTIGPRTWAALVEHGYR